MGATEDKVEQRIKDMYGNLHQFSKATGIAYSTVNNALKRGLGGSGIDTVLPICKALGLDPMALGESRLSTYNDDPNYVDVPLYGSIAAGEPIEMCEIDDYHPIPKVMADKYPDGFLLEVRGESMNRVLPNYSYALINPMQVVDNGKVYALNVNGDDATIKRVVRLNNGFKLVPDSNDPTFVEQVYDYGKEDTKRITIIGEVVYYVLPFNWKF